MTKAALLVAWLVQAILAWTPGAPVTDERAAEVDGLSRVLLATAFRSDEAPAYAGPSGRARSALLVAAIGSQESAFLRRIQDGDCRCHRRPGYKVSCECDGAEGASGRPYFQAACYLQIHADERGGIGLVGDGWTYGDDLAKGSRVYHNRDLLGDPASCFLVGLHMARRSVLHMGGRLCGYTGEEGPCPKADHRQGLADRWFAQHPPPATDAEVAGP